MLHSLAGSTKYLSEVIFQLLSLLSMLPQSVVIVDKEMTGKGVSMGDISSSRPDLGCDPAGLCHHQDCAEHKIRRRKAFCLSDLSLSVQQQALAQLGWSWEHHLQNQAPAGGAFEELAPPVRVSFPDTLL